jgi:hypothetical protein
MFLGKNRSRGCNIANPQKNKGAGKQGSYQNKETLER